MGVWARGPVFDRVVVDHLVAGGTRVSWRLSDRLAVPPPHTFTLQWADHAVADADDWVDVGLPVVDATYAIDGDRRLHGMAPTSHYRVRLDAGPFTWTSPPAAAFAAMPVRDWLIARQLVRSRTVRSRVGTGQRCWLLHRKRRGAGQGDAAAADPERMAVDPITGAARAQRVDPATRGTPFLGGYYPPVACWADLGPTASQETINPPGRGTVDDAARARAEVVLFPYPRHKDLLVDAGDQRYEVRKVTETGRHRGVPLFGVLDLAPLPYSDPAYAIEVPDASQWDVGWYGR